MSWYFLLFRLDNWIEAGFRGGTTFDIWTPIVYHFYISQPNNSCKSFTAHTSTYNTIGSGIHVLKTTWLASHEILIEILSGFCIAFHIFFKVASPVSFLKFDMNLLRLIKSSNSYGIHEYFLFSKTHKDSLYCLRVDSIHLIYSGFNLNASSWDLGIFLFFNSITELYHFLSHEFSFRFMRGSIIHFTSYK